MTTNDSDQPKTNSTDDEVYRAGTKEDVRSVKTTGAPVSPNKPLEAGTKEDVREVGTSSGSTSQPQPDTLRDGAKKPT